VPVATADGPEMTESETVTLFNDMCFMAPATLIDRAIEWKEVDAHTVKARFTNAGHTIRADLLFDDAGMLMNFISDDRYQSSGNGTAMRQLRWSTPIAKYRTFGAVRLMSEGEARWHEAESAYAYIQLTIDDIRYNVRPR
jgi:hypothetical protein